MAIKKAVHKWTHICPVRFERAVSDIYPKQSSLPVRFSPDIDDRGFAADTQAITGPVMSIMMVPGTSPGTPGDIYKVKLVRMDIDSGAPLLAKSTNDAVAKVHNPSGNNLVGSIEHDIELEPVSVGDAKVQILYDGNDKFVLGELTVKVVDAAHGGRIWVRPYLVTIADATGANPIGPAVRDLKTLFRKVNDIWWPHGLQFGLWREREKSLRLTQSGTIATDAEFSNALKANDTGGRPPSVNAVNVLFVSKITGALGCTYAPPLRTGRRKPTDDYGVAIGDPDPGWPDAMVVAHELGHYFQLDHTDQKLYPGEGSDSWNLRCLMTNHYPHKPPNPPWHHDVGYGHGNAGALITIRDLGRWDHAAGHKSVDGEHKIARDAAKQRCY